MLPLNVQTGDAGAPEATNARQFAPVASDTVNAFALAANTSERQSIPAGARYAAFSTSAVSPVDFVAKFGDGTATAAIPAADITDGSGAPLNPAIRRIPACATHLALCASAATTITVEFWN